MCAYTLYRLQFYGQRPLQFLPQKSVWWLIHFAFCILHFTEGCQAYGHVCYGGHGKRSLNAGSDGAASAAGAAQEEYVRPNGLLPMLAPNEQAPVVPEAEFDDYPSRQVLYKIMKSWVGVQKVVLLTSLSLISLNLLEFHTKISFNLYIY